VAVHDSTFNKLENTKTHTTFMLTRQDAGPVETHCIGRGNVKEFRKRLFDYI